MVFVSFRRARRFTAPRRMPEFPMAFHSPSGIRNAPVAGEAVQLGQLEDVLISGASAVWSELLLLDESPNTGRRAVAEVLGGFSDRERPWRTHQAHHRR